MTHAIDDRVIRGRLVDRKRSIRVSRGKVCGRARLGGRRSRLIHVLAGLSFLPRTPDFAHRRPRELGLSTRHRRDAQFSPPLVNPSVLDQPRTIESRSPRTHSVVIRAKCTTLKICHAWQRNRPLLRNLRGKKPCTLFMNRALLRVRRRFLGYVFKFR